MSEVHVDMALSLDGFIVGPGVEPGPRPLGEGGERLHEWMFRTRSWSELHGEEGGETGPSDEVVRETVERTGATLMGRLMYDTGEEPWGDDPYPVFVVTHRGREPLEKEGGTTFHFVTDGVESALAQAKAAAGGKDVRVGGGASVVQQLLAAGLIDEVQIHVAPVLFGEGTRLFEGLGRNPIELEAVRVLEAPDVTHIKYRVER